MAAVAAAGGQPPKYPHQEEEEVNYDEDKELEEGSALRNCLRMTSAIKGKSMAQVSRADTVPAEGPADGHQDAEEQAPEDPGTAGSNR
jgi:hypothetical protein